MSSPPPESILIGNNLSNDSVPPPIQTNKKRKRIPAAAPSPAPSDSASTQATSTPNAPTNESLVSRGDLTGRPILTVSRGPIFVLCTDTPNPQSEPYFRTDLASANRVGFRYVPAGIKPPGHASAFRTIESNPTSYRVSWEDRNSNIKVTKDGLGLAGSGGYRSARCNAPMREGNWYLEVKIVHGGGERVQYSGNSDENGSGGGPVKVRREGSHVRLGWGRREASLNTTVGADGYSYGYCDKNGDKTTLSRLRPYGKPFSTGDVIGMYISLPPRRKPNPKDSNDPAHLRRERIPIDLKGQEVFELLEYPQSKEMTALMDWSGKTTQSSSVPSNSGKKSGPNTGKPPETTTNISPRKYQQPLRPLSTLGPESKIAFFVNGDCQGVAFQDLYDYLQLRQPKDKLQKSKERRKAREGVKEHRQNPFDDGWLGYYPFISLFNDGAVHINPGPDFEYPPPPDIDALLEGRDPLAPPAAKKPKFETENADPQQDDMAVDVDVDVKPARTWRPACERYAEFTQEQWDMDAVEEEEAKIELNKWQETTKREEEKAEHRRKKRREAEAKRRAKKAADVEAKKREVTGLPPREDGTATPNQLNIPGTMGSLGPGYTSSAHPSPSPLRYSTAAYDLDREIESAALESERNSAAPRGRSNTSELAEPSHYDGLVEEDGMAVDQEQVQQEQRGEEERDGNKVYIRVELPDSLSPAPTATSYVGHGGSEYASDFQEEEQEEGVEIYVDVEEGEEEEEGETEESKHRQRIEYVREEEEEEE